MGGFKYNGRKMHCTEYIEYTEEEDKKYIKREKKSFLVPNLCDICKKQYKTKISLSAHMKSVHQGIKYPCKQCEYKATQQSSLKKHFESVHKKRESQVSL